MINLKKKTGNSKPRMVRLDRVWTNLLKDYHNLNMIAPPHSYHRQRDKTKLFKEAEIIQALNFGKIQIESAIDELKNTDMIRLTMISHDRGVLYSLTEKGKKYLNIIESPIY